MNRLETASESKPQGKTARIASLAVTLIASICFIGCDSNESSSSSADQVVAEMVKALRVNDKATLDRLFGPDAEEVLTSGDEVADKNRINKFLAAYDEKHQLQEHDGKVTLLVGNKDWPLPVPIVKDDSGKWYFDVDAGKEEMLNRRIGQNELDVIRVCEAIVDAQKEYAARDPDGNDVPEYATKFMSDPGKKNGLYWDTAEGEPPSPLGKLVADAVEQGYKATTTPTPRPYHGYCYRMLKAQGPNAKGGALDYVVNGMMIGGFAAVAYPADYGNSGIMTFMVSFDGTVYQKDLGPDTDKIAKAMEQFDPGPGWQIVPAAKPDTTAAAGGVTPNP